MSQTGHNWPREFKFVGGPSRKRRRNAPREATTPKRTSTGAAIFSPGVASPEIAVSPSPAVSIFDAGYVLAAGPISSGDHRHMESQHVQLPIIPQQESKPDVPVVAQVVEEPFLEGPAVANWATGEYLNPCFAATLDPFLFDGDEPALPLPPLGEPITLSSVAISASTESSIDSPISNSSSSNSSLRTHDHGEPESSHASPENIFSPLYDGIRLPDSPESPGSPDSLESIDMPVGLPLYKQPSALHDTLTRMFDRYDQEFCLLPITHDCRTNPFRFALGTVRHFRLLRYSILALSYKHASHDTGGACAREATIYRRKSFQLLRDEMARSSRPDVSLLDAVTVLLTLSCATSGFGSWSTQFLRVERILRDTPTSSLSPQRYSQLTLLVWFDVILALTNRAGARLPAASIRSITNENEKPDYDEEFFAITGCPLELFRMMVRLAAYAHEHRLAASMSCVRFHDAPIKRLQRRIAEWTSPSFAAPSLPDNLWVGVDTEQTAEDTSGPSLDDCLDRYHCAEAWRHALLLYICRVFAPLEEAGGSEEDEQRPQETHTSSPSTTGTSPVLTFLARTTLNHVKACRSTTLVQKQLLMPVFLAGCETPDEGLRADARAFCVWWSTRTRYHMFITARALLDDVWRQGRWWGAVLDQRADNGKEYLLG